MCVGALNVALLSPPNGDARVVVAVVVDGFPSDADALLPPRARSRPCVKDDLFVRSRIDRAIFADNARSASCAFFRACSIARSIALTRFDGDVVVAVASFVKMSDDAADAAGEPTSRSYDVDDGDAADEDDDDRRNESGGTDALVDIASASASRVAPGCAVAPHRENLVYCCDSNGHQFVYV